MSGHDIDGQALRQLRLAARLQPAELAERIGRSAPFVRNLELGRKRPSLATVRALETALGVTADQFGATGIPPATRQETAA